MKKITSTIMILLIITTLGTDIFAKTLDTNKIKIADQGQTYACVSYSLNYALELFGRKINPIELHKNISNGEGSYILDGLEYLKTKKQINRYYEVNNIYEIKTAIDCYEAPAVISIKISNDFDTMYSRYNKESFRFNHAICIIGVNMKKKEVSFINSWGLWGNQGYGIIKMEIFEQVFNYGYVILE